MNPKYSEISSLALKIFSKRDIKKVVALSILNALLGILDLLGVGLIGLLSFMTVSGLTSSRYPEGLILLLQSLKIDNLTFQVQVAILGLVAVTLLISRTLFSFLFTKRMLYFLSFRSALVTSKLVRLYFKKPLEEIYSKALPDLTWQLTDGVRALMMGIVGTSIFMLGDISLLLIMSLALFFMDPLTATLLFISFSALSIAVYYSFHNKALKLSYENSELIIKSNQQVNDLYQSIKQIKVKNQEDYMTDCISKVRYASAPSFAELAFMPNISKFAIEIFLVFASLVVSGVQFWLNDAKTAITSLTVFMAAGSRIAPALLRVQQNMILMRGSLGYSKSIIEMFDSFDSRQDFVQESVMKYHKSFTPKVEFQNVSFSYPNSETEAINDVTFQINPGEFFGVIGKSGSGKSTLVDLMLGLIEPKSGEIHISSLRPNEAINQFSGKIAYVPQNLNLIAGTIRENVILGEPLSKYSDDQIKKIVDEVELGDLIRRIEGGLDGYLGENGNLLSGGEAQRIVLARALISEPELLILDESTSSLDNATESRIMELLTRIKRHTNIVLITHKLSSTSYFDRVIILQSGSILDIGAPSQIQLGNPYKHLSSGLGHDA